MKNKHLFFDLDRTLWDFEKNSEKALQHLYEESRLRDRIPSFQRFHQTYKNENALLWKKYGKGKIDKAYLRDARFSRTFLKFDIVDAALTSYFSEGYIELSPRQTCLFPNTHETLSDLQKEGYRLHIITNGFKEVQHIKLAESGLTNYFDLVLCSEEVGVNKPAPGIFAHALKSTGASPTDSVMIGDDFEVDILGAVQSGMHAIHFDPEEKRKRRADDWRIRDLSELPEMLPWLFK